MCSPMGSSPMLGTVLEAWCWDQPSARPHLSVCLTYNKDTFCHKNTI